MYHNAVIFLIIGGLAAAGCAIAEETSKCNLAADIEAVKAAEKQAKAVGGEWRDTADLVKKSEQAAEAGDCEGAKKLYATARFQYEMGHQQAVSQANVGNPEYLSK